MSNWTNLAGTASTIAGAGVGITYYALMRQNIELDRQQLAADEVIASDETHAITEDVPKTDDQSQEIGNGDAVVEASNSPTKSTQEEVIQDDLSDKVLLTDEISDEDISELQKVQSEMEDLLEYLKSKQEDTRSSTMEEQDCTVKNSNIPKMQVSDTLMAQKDELVDQNFEVGYNNDKGNTLECVHQSDLEFSDIETEQARLVLPGSPQSHSVQKGYSPSWRSYIFWPFKIFPAKYSGFVIFLLFCMLWLVCALVAYTCLEFLYYQYEIEKSYIPYHKLASTLSKLNWGEQQQQQDEETQVEFERSPNTWHW